ncbi:hypothetical protein ATANTOWER_016776 [Ataeniobius toweri]|uniref:Uncharacterized protein n=1 Tax=Ataeniobius toweri TaxID=208326 RepID=A0ABU7B237_9TELE|nr:hypothetical protein [Ataeniobius toweri]
MAFEDASSLGKTGEEGLKMVGENEGCSCIKCPLGALSPPASTLCCELIKEEKSLSPKAWDYDLTSTQTAGTTTWMSSLDTPLFHYLCRCLKRTPKSSIYTFLSHIHFPERG